MSIARPPRALPAGSGIVYYQIERDQVFWRDVADTCSMAIRMNLARATFQSDRILVGRATQGEQDHQPPVRSVRHLNDLI